MEWGEPFLGRRVWYSRFLFRPHRWFDRPYFERFLQGIGVDQDLSAQEAIWFNFSLSLLVLLFAVVVSLYLVKHRTHFVQQLLALPRSTFGRWFLLGLGLYVGAQIIENAVNLLPGSSVSPFVEGRDATDVPRLLNYYFMRSLDEPLECVGAAAFWIASLTLCFRSAKASADIEEGALDDDRETEDTAG